MDDGRRNHIKIEATSFADGTIKDIIGQEMSVISETMTQGTLNEWVGTSNVWSRTNGYSQMPLYDFYHQTGDIVSRDRWYNQRKTSLWFLFFHGLWLETGQNLLKVLELLLALLPERIRFVRWLLESSWEHQHWGGHFLSAAMGRNLTTDASSRFTTSWKPLNYLNAVAQYPALTYDS
ncbi:hypothetical protein DFS34DRAFT_696342 [Phlyctochytrium arcticum]|nr:hypothetical protein DFS34DRAFT_696342 [Phlyctochytrium arcticum]